MVRCLQAWRRHVETERAAREDVVRQRLRRAKDGIRARVFEHWVIYTESSLAIDRMRRRVILRPVLRAWSKRALADRVKNRMFWACAKLASRALRYDGRRRFVETRQACCKIQHFARGVITRAKVQRELAEDIIQAVEVKRVIMSFAFSCLHNLTPHSSGDRLIYFPIPILYFVVEDKIGIADARRNSSYSSVIDNSGFHVLYKRTLLLGFKLTLPTQASIDGRGYNCSQICEEYVHVAGQPSFFLPTVPTAVARTRMHSDCCSKTEFSCTLSRFDFVLKSEHHGNKLFMSGT